MKRWLTYTAICAAFCVFALPGWAQTNTVIPMVSAHRQFLDSSGNPLASGCVFTYSAGTTSAAPTYTDSTGSFQNSNPVILDSGGFANIWLGQLSYKFTVKAAGGTSCATGATQWSEDSIPGANVSSGAVAFSSLTAAANVSAGTFSASGNTWDFTAASALKAPTSAGYAPTVNGSFGYDTTNNKWVFGANGATRNFGLASAAACGAGQFVSTPATATAAAICSAPSLSGSTCSGCTINAASTFTASNITASTIGSSTISTSTLSGTITRSHNSTETGPVVISDATHDVTMTWNSHGPAGTFDMSVDGSAVSNVVTTESSTSVNITWDGSYFHMWINGADQGRVTLF